MPGFEGALYTPVLILYIIESLICMAWYFPDALIAATSM
jgi:hypothetical protein